MRHSHQSPNCTLGLLLFCLLMAGCVSSQRVVAREIIGKDGAPMALVSAGEFLFRDSTSHQRKSLPGFHIDKYELTTRRYAKFLHETGREIPLYLERGESGERWRAACNRRDVARCGRVLSLGREAVTDGAGVAEGGVGNGRAELSVGKSRTESIARQL